MIQKGRFLKHIPSTILHNSAPFPFKGNLAVCKSVQLYPGSTCGTVCTGRRHHSPPRLAFACIEYRLRQPHYNNVCEYVNAKWMSASSHPLGALATSAQSATGLAGLVQTGAHKQKERNPHDARRREPRDVARECAKIPMAGATGSHKQPLR